MERAQSDEATGRSRTAGASPVRHDTEDPGYKAGAPLEPPHSRAHGQPRVLHYFLRLGVAADDGRGEADQRCVKAANQDAVGVQESPWRRRPRTIADRQIRSRAFGWPGFLFSGAAALGGVRGVSARTPPVWANRSSYPRTPMPHSIGARGFTEKEGAVLKCRDFAEIASRPIWRVRWHPGAPWQRYSHLRLCGPCRRYLEQDRRNDPVRGSGPPPPLALGE